MHFPYPRFCISAVLFQYSEEHQDLICGQILKPFTCIIQMISLASQNFSTSLTLRWQLLYIFYFTLFQYMQQFTGMQYGRMEYD
jgi:hypothetical protein